MSDETDPSDSLADASTVLIIAPDVRDAPVGACAGLAANGGTALDRAVGVTVGQSPADWLDAWGRQASAPEASLTCVDVHSKTRSAAAVGVGTDRSAAALRTVPDATDLGTLGETLTEIMVDAEAVDDRVAVCIHSLTDLLGHVDEEAAFGFLCALGERAREFDAIVCVHLDASAHDERTAEVFSAVCDAVVEFDDGIEMRVR